MAKTLQQLQEAHKSASDAAKAVLDKADADAERDLTADEEKEFSVHIAAAKKLQKQIEQRQGVDQAVGFSQTPNPRVTEQLPPVVESPSAPAGGDGAALMSVEFDGMKLSVPRRLTRRGQLRAFNEPNGEALAYGFGMICIACLGQYGGAAAQTARNWLRGNGLGYQWERGDVQQLGGQSSQFELGGFLIPDAYEARLIRLVEQYGVARQFFERIPMGSSDKVDRPRRTSGLTAYFTVEKNDITESNLTGDLVTLIAKDIWTLTPLPSNLNEDAVISIGDLMFLEIAQAFAYKEDLCGFTGDGTSTYGGIQGIVPKFAANTSLAGYSAAATGHTAFSSLTMSDFHACMALLPAYAAQSPNCAWYVSKAGWDASMSRLAIASGGTTVAEVQAGVRVLLFLGYPVRWVQVMNATLAADASKVKILFGDLARAAMFGDRKGADIAMSEHAYFKSGQIAVRGHERFDCNSHSIGDNTTAGPVVCLATPAS